MFDQTLTERIEAAGRGEYRPDRVSETLHMESILRSVRQLLNDRQACCETRPDYGMPDLNDLLGGSNPNAAFIVADTIRSLIERFEPRLVNVDVRTRPDPEGLAGYAFEILGETTLGDDTSRVAFRSVITADRMLKVTE